MQKHDFNVMLDYFLLAYPGLSEKTRSIIVSFLSSMIDVLNRGVLRELFCTETNITPAATLDGKIIIVDLPVKEYNNVGLFAATIWKYLFQRTVERRNPKKQKRPVFLFVDESHLFATKFDALFQSTARSSLCSTVYLTQNIQNYFAAYGGASGKGNSGAGTAETLSLLGNLTHQIVHALGDSETAEYMAKLCGQSKQLLMNHNDTDQSSWKRGEWFDRDYSQSSSQGFNEALMNRVEPSEFFTLQPGSLADRRAEAIVWRGGRVFPSTGVNYLRTFFPQS
jgi:type IV secretory pathway TraG/TraD family ATPase VirD4